MRRNLEDKGLDLIIYSSLIILAFLTLYPFWNSLAISFNAGADTARGGITFWPREFTFANYEYVFDDERLINGFMITIIRTVLGTLLSISFTAAFGYAMAKRGLIGKKYYMIFCVVTMYFHGGLIPTYLLIRELNMMNTIWVMVIPTMINVWHMIIFRTFFQQLPDGLEESAKIDGCSNAGVFFKIVVPVSGPVIATLSLFTAVFHWNAWFDAVIYITKEDLVPLQTLLTQIINSVMNDTMDQLSNTEQEMLDQLNAVTHKSVVMATMMVATIPIMMVYPFVQKYFVKGVLIGSLKE
ncbi:carbohydrate ABC transporter permease [Paenibacillus sp. J5C_2022]|uniref:carbohydrate ABC transporter permease n=1 Tax=Paenibacillus sp. J5C2022 TaxID=2977129 RepID=UPI0021CFF33B|nr:carbohydrate ABC transporter permease [Paenibacillus sp. J5C2022]MCU6710738.1 carbohydrate ABC transporter permease [Paenibacillus sp. J5C2022]